MQTQDTDFKNAHLTRQMDLIPVHVLGIPIHIVGAGAVGSFTALSLAKTGFNNITVYDDDEVSIENMNSQFYRFKDIGSTKTKALQDLVMEFTQTKIKSVFGKWAPNIPVEMRGIVINAADSMQVRKDLFDFCTKDFRIHWFIDGRMGAENALMYTMNPQSKKDQESYAKTLYTDKDAVAEKCTAKATCYTATMLAGMIVKSVKDLATKAEYPRIVMWNIKDNQQQVWKGGV